MKYFEIIVASNRRPDHPEDNTIILKANSMTDVIQKYNENIGKFLTHGELVNCRRIYYVYDFE